LPKRPKVFFEEWDEPLISGIGCVSELVEIAGGIDIFADRKHQGAAKDRVVTADEVVAREPDLIRNSPVLPLIGGGTTKFQPVFIDDMTAGLLEILKRSETAGQTYKFGGPQVYSFKTLLELLLTALNRQRVLLPIPFALAEMQAGLLELLPNPPLTRDQVRLLKTDKVVSGMEPTLGDLGVHPRPLEEFLTVFKAKPS
jgi:nucleoside-diphosphate-sugar epimerase